MQRFEYRVPQGELSVCQWRQAAEGEKKPVLHWAHANGFNGQTYAPLLEPLQNKFDVYAWDARGHGRTKLPAEPKTMTGWNIYADDLEHLISHLAEQAGEKIWLGGHSMGGCASIMVAAKRPDLVAGLILADPVIVPSFGAYLFKLYSRLRNTGGHMLMRMAAKRRANWPDAATLEAAYTGRGAFATWQDGFLAAYVRGGVKPIDDGQGNSVTLACAPLWEAANFKGPQVASIPWVKKLRVPFTLLMAEHGSTTRGASAFHKPQVAKTISVVAGSSHFLPMEFPDRLRHEIRQRAGLI